MGPGNKAAIEDIAAYLVRPLVSLGKLVYLDGEKAVPYRSNGVYSNRARGAGEPTQPGVMGS